MANSLSFVIHENPKIVNLQEPPFFTPLPIPNCEWQESLVQIINWPIRFATIQFRVGPHSNQFPSGKTDVFEGGPCGIVSCWIIFRLPTPLSPGSSLKSPDISLFIAVNAGDFILIFFYKLKQYLAFYQAYISAPLNGEYLGGFGKTKSVFTLNMTYIKLLQHWIKKLINPSESL